MNTSFNDFWNLYDNKKSRDKCERKWFTLSAKDQAACMESLPQYIKSTPERQYRKHPATYLNNKCWNDKIYTKDEENQIYMPPKEFERTTYQSATPKEMYEGIKKIALQTGKLMKVADWSGAYRYAWNANLIPRMDKIKRKAYKASVREALKSEIRAKMKPENFNIDNSIQSECERRVIQAHFQELINKRI